MGINSSDPSKVAADSKHAPLPKVDRYFESSVHRVFDPIVAQAKVYTDWRKGIEQNFLPFNPGDKPMTRKDIFPPRSSDGLIHNSTHEVLGWFAANHATPPFGYCRPALLELLSTNPDWLEALIVCCVQWDIYTSTTIGGQKHYLLSPPPVPDHKYMLKPVLYVPRMNLYGLPYSDAWGVIDLFEAIITPPDTATFDVALIAVDYARRLSEYPQLIARLEELKQATENEQAGSHDTRRGLMDRINRVITRIDRRPLIRAQKIAFLTGLRPPRAPSASSSGGGGGGGGASLKDANNNKTKSKTPSQQQPTQPSALYAFAGDKHLYDKNVLREIFEFL